MALYILLYLVYLIPTLCVHAGVYRHDAVAVFQHGLPALNKDIRTRSKTATGQQSSSLLVTPHAAPSSGSYEVAHQPYVKVSKSSKHGKGDDSKGEQHDMQHSKKSSGRSKHHHKESGKKGHKGKESSKKEYGDESGKKKEYHDQGGFHKEHDGARGGGGKEGFKHGGKRDKGHVHKGFRDLYHKDEAKKLDSFWSNEHKEGKWFTYGAKKHKNASDGKKKKAEKKHHESKEEDSYKKEKCTKC